MTGNLLERIAELHLQLEERYDSHDLLGYFSVNKSLDGKLDIKFRDVNSNRRFYQTFGDEDRGLECYLSNLRDALES